VARAHTFLHPRGWKLAKGFSDGVVAEGRTVFLAGQVGWNAEQRFESNLLYAQLFALADDPRRVYDLHVDWARRCATSLLNQFDFSPRDRSPARRLRLDDVGGRLRGGGSGITCSGFGHG